MPPPHQFADQYQTYPWGSLSQHWYSSFKAEGRLNILALNLFSLLKQIRLAALAPAPMKEALSKKELERRNNGWYRGWRALLSHRPGQGLGFRSKTWKITVWCVFSWQLMSILYTEAKSRAELVVLTDINHHSACQPGAQAPSWCFLGARLCAGLWNGNMGKTWSLTLRSSKKWSNEPKQQRDLALQWGCLNSRSSEIHLKGNAYFISCLVTRNFWCFVKRLK